MIDEIDKMGADFRGDPSSAMLEVLDPEQNSTFRDHYLDLPFDLSRVLFITTANQLEPIPAPLRDRMEVIQLAGYTEEEKLEIAKRYLVPRQIEQNGLGKSKIEFTDEALREVIEGYTREAGVRNLEREIGAICRKVAREFAEGTRQSKRTIRPKQVAELLGRRRVQPEVARRTGEPGVATGLAWTPVGGDVLFVEATAFPGEGKLQVTGQLGDVMKESAAAALSYVKRNVPRSARTCRRTGSATNDIHLHVPAGAIPKDGPSAGHHDGHRAGLARHRAAGALRHRDDRRDHAHRPGAADRRAQGEGAGRAARGDHARDRAASATSPTSRSFPANLKGTIEFVFVESVDEVLDEALEAPAACEAPVAEPRRAAGDRAAEPGSGGRRLRCPAGKARVGLPGKRIDADRGELWQPRRRPRRLAPERSPRARPPATTRTCSAWSRTTSCATTCARPTSPRARRTAA